MDKGDVRIGQRRWPLSARLALSCLLVTALLGCQAKPTANPSSGIEPGAPWTKHVIGKTTANTSSAVASDFDGDGHIDVMCSYAGKVALYRGPDWKKTIVLPQMPPDRNGVIAKRGCIHSTLMDVDGDGDMDYIGSNRMLFWLECPDKPFEQPWHLRMISHDVNGAHGVHTADVDRDGTIDLIANSWRDIDASPIPNSITWFAIPDDPTARQDFWQPHVFADQDAPGRNHYMGFGDLNNDGRGDISCAAPAGGWVAWWQQPEDATAKWTKHLVSDDDPGATNVLNLDLDADGQLDILLTRGHEKGALWFKGPSFTKIMIDPEIELPHCLDAADIDNDGDLDFTTTSSSLTGQTAWYENDGQANFTKHVIDTQQSAYDTRLIDMDKDGDLDILLGGQLSFNVVWYENPLIDRN